MNRPVVVTGMGTVGPHGCGRRELIRALQESTPLTAEVDRSAGYHRRRSACMGTLLREDDLGQWVPPRTARRMSPSSRYAVAAARMAWEDAGFAESDLGLRPMAVSLATCLGPISQCERILEQMKESGPEMTSPFLFTESVANAPAAQVAIAFQAREGNFTCIQREAGPLGAVLRGVAEVESGRAEHALAGSVDELTPLVHAILDRYGALAQAWNGGSELGRPFDRHRNGFLMGEGATVLLLEAEEAARARGARVIARIRGGGQANDPTATATSWGTDHESLGRALAACMRRASLEPIRVDRILSGASGAIAGDRLEALTLRTAWAEMKLPPILAPKAVTGEYGGGFLASTMVALEGTSFGPTAGFEHPDPALEIVPHDGRPLDAPRTVVASALASTGAAAWLFLERS